MTDQKNYIILFDLDNTLIEIVRSHEHFDQIIVDVFKRAGVPIPKDRDRDKLWRNNDYESLLKSWDFQDPVLFWRLFDEIDLERRRRIFKDGRIRIYDDVIPVLNDIKKKENIFSAIISNTTQKIVEFQLNKLRMRNLFDRIYGLGEFQSLCKPSPKGVNLILSDFAESINFSKSNVYIIGDTPNDIAAGKRANIKTVFINRKNRDLEELGKYQPDYTINTLNELTDLITSH
ncbi:MAG: HAD hydrolase-like protein [Candidatus Lokiarchaeota archaeon]|nr:HAD hydrolase-like protein [Candidatus Lokiarchaeota archaeon]